VAEVAGRKTAPGTTRVLVRHFLRQSFSLEAIATGGEIREIVFAVLTLLAAPGYLLAVLTLIGGPRMGRYWEVAGLPPLLVFWKEEWLILTFSMAAAAVVAAVQWKSFVLDVHDYRILGPLPVRRAPVLLAKLASLAIVLLVLHLAVNSLSGLLMPGVSPAGYFRTLLALQLTLLLQTVFVCASVLAVQALATAALPSALAQRVATLVQAGFLLAAAVLVVSAEWLSLRMLALHDTPHTLHRVVPVAWFMAAYKPLLGLDGSVVAADARTALVATAAAMIVAVAGCLLGYRDTEGRGTPAAGLLERWAAALDRAFRFRHPARPRARGISAFIGKALQRSPTVALLSRGWLVLGIAIVLAGLGAATARGQLQTAVPSAATVAPGIVLPFFGLVGLRLAAAYPANLEANWLFRLTETAHPADHATAIRVCALRAVVLPWVALPFAAQAFLWGLGTALPLALLGLAIGLVSAEWLFLGFRKIPFTCSYLPGKADLRRSWPLAALVGFVYCIALPAIVAHALRQRSAWLMLLALLMALWACLLLLSKGRARGEPLVFDEKAVPLVTQLHWDE
jgi:hypothetical protein